MAKQTFTTGQVLTAAQMTSLQQTAMGGGSATAKTASYVLVAADAGTTVAMNAAGATTITVNTALFSAGDSVFIQNWGAGTCTVTAGTATVTTHGSLALGQWEGGTLYFTSASAAIFFDISQSTGMTNPMTTTGDTIYSSSGSTPARLGIGSTGNVLTVAGGVPTWAAPAGGGKVLQVVNGSTSTAVNITTTTQTDTGLTATITPTLNTSKILVLVNQTVAVERASGNNTGVKQTLLRGSTVIGGTATSRALSLGDIVGATGVYFTGIIPYSVLDAPATTSATTYKTQGSVPAGPGADTVNFQPASIVSSIVLLEIGA
jgi:hypothetical protein